MKGRVKIACMMVLVVLLSACGDDDPGITIVDFSGDGDGSNIPPAPSEPPGGGGLIIRIPPFEGELQFTRAMVSITKIELKISNSGHGSTEDVKKEGQFFMDLAEDDPKLRTPTGEIVSLDIPSGKFLEEFRFRIDDVDEVSGSLPQEILGYSILLDGQVELNGQSFPFQLRGDLNEEIEIPTPTTSVSILGTLVVVFRSPQIFNVDTDNNPLTTPIQEIARIVSDTIASSGGTGPALLDVHSETDDPARSLARLIEDRFDDEIDLFNKTADEESEHLVIQSRG